MSHPKEWIHIINNQRDYLLEVPFKNPVNQYYYISVDFLQFYISKFT